MADALNAIIPALLLACAALVALRGYRNLRAGRCARCPYRGNCRDERKMNR